MNVARVVTDRINSLDHETLVWASEHPNKARGWIEAYMVCARAMNPAKLPALGKLK